jgi:hypothetical protein
MLVEDFSEAPRVRASDRTSADPRRSHVVEWQLMKGFLVSGFIVFFVRAGVLWVKGSGKGHVVSSGCRIFL